MRMSQVMDSLYQTGVKKAETDLLIDQLREVFSRLTTQYKVSPYLACIMSFMLEAEWQAAA